MPELSHSNLEALLSAVAIDYPPTPQLAGPVAARLAQGPAAPSRSLRRPPFAWAAIAAAVAAVALGAGLALSSDARESVASFLGLAVEGERIEVAPTPPPGQTSTPPATATPVELGVYGREATMAEAASVLGREPRLPRGLGSPERIYVLPFAELAGAVFQYEGMDLWEVRLGRSSVEKLVSGEEVVAELEVDGRPAYWVTGGHRVVVFENADGDQIAGSERVVDRNTLLWSANGIYYRVEIAGTLEDALEIAESLSAGNQ